MILQNLFLKKFCCYSYFSYHQSYAFGNSVYFRKYSTINGKTNIISNKSNKIKTYNIHKRKNKSNNTSKEYLRNSYINANDKVNEILTNKYNEAQSNLQKQVEDWSEIITRWYQNYQDFVGITSLTQSQDRVKTVSDN